MTFPPKSLSKAILLIGLAVGCAHPSEPKTAGTNANATSAQPETPSAHTARAKARAEREQLAVADSLQPILFAFGSADLTPESKVALDQNITLFKRWPAMQILVEGHTDEKGDLTYNLNLAEERASNVRTYMTDHGIDLGRVVIASQGENEEQTDTTPDTKAEAKADRRTEFIVVWKAPAGPVADNAPTPNVP